MEFPMALQSRASHSAASSSVDKSCYTMKIFAEMLVDDYTWEVRAATRMAHTGFSTAQHRLNVFFSSFRVHTSLHPQWFNVHLSRIL